MSYKCFVCKISTRPHHNPKYEKIHIGTVYGSDVIVTKGVQTGDLGVYFPPDGQLSLKYCTANKLLRTDGGYLEVNRKVKAIKLCEIESMGIWIPIDSLSTFGDVNTLKEGDEVSIFNGTEICCKYITPAAVKRINENSNKKKNKKDKKTKQVFFPKHYDTSQWKFCKNIPRKGSIVIITEKLHGTSGRTGKLLTKTEIKQTFLRKLATCLGFKLNKTEEKYEIHNGSRNVSLGTIEEIDKKKEDIPGFYGSNGFRWDAIKDWSSRLNHNEVVYYEIVGYTGQSPIQKCDNIEKRMSKKYGGIKTMHFSYGCIPCQFEVYVYRICHVDPFTQEQFDYSWTQIQKRCEQLGLKTVPELDRFIYDGDLQPLEARIEAHVSGDSTLTDKHLREGACARFEQENGIFVVKSKSFDFFVIEGLAKDDDNHVDPEEEN